MAFSSSSIVMLNVLAQDQGAGRSRAEMGIKSFIRLIFGGVAAPRDAARLDGTTEAALARSLSALPPEERGWITSAEARSLFSSEGAQYAFGETDRVGRRNIESFAARHRSVVNFMPVEDRVYFVRDPTVVISPAPERNRPPEA
jgi:hypothetical protein